MRRLIAYIGLAVSLIVATALNVFAPIRGLNSNLEYTNGREFVYQINAKTDTETVTGDLPDGALDEIF